MTSAIPVMVALPIALFGTIAIGTSRQPAPALTAKSVQLEHITAQRMDDATFRRRWSPLYDMPPATEVRYVTESTSRVADAVPVAASPPAYPPRHRQLRSKPAQLDICGRHRMKKVWVSSKRWRCRR